MKNTLSFFLAIVLILACICMLVVAARTPNAVTVNIIGRATNVAGVSTVSFQITNRSSHSLVISYGTQIATNGPLKWYPAKSQMKDFKFGQPLPGKSARNFEFSTPSEGVPWRVYVVYNWPPGTFRARIDDALKKLKLSKRTVALTQEIDR
jgi:hypothetical protein